MGRCFARDARGEGSYLVRLTVEVDDVVSYCEWAKKIGMADFVESFTPDTYQRDFQVVYLPQMDPAKPN